MRTVKKLLILNMKVSVTYMSESVTSDYYFYGLLFHASFKEKSVSLDG